MQVFGEYPAYIDAYWQEHGVRPDITDEDALALKGGTVDYYMFSYYASGCIANGERTASNPYVKANAWGREIDPVGLKYVLHRLNDRYRIPLMIVENGIGLIDVPGGWHGAR